MLLGQCKCSVPVIEASPSSATLAENCAESAITEMPHSSDGRNLDLDSLTELIVKVIRTQFVAVLGNLTIAFPVAYLLASGYFMLAGHHFVAPDKAQLVVAFRVFGAIGGDLADRVQPPLRLQVLQSRLARR